MSDPRAREQARLRQAEKRKRDRAHRIDEQAAAVATAKLPKAWQAEFLRDVRRETARANKARAEVEKTAEVFSGDTVRAAYLKRNYSNTKVSVSKLFNKFVKQKVGMGQALLYRT